MNKNSFISIFLLLAFTFLLAHNFIPHHHHVDIVETDHRSHEHGHAHHHHSDSSDHKKNQEKKSHEDKEHESHFSYTDLVFTHSDLTNIFSKRKDLKISHPTSLLENQSAFSFQQVSIKEKPPLIIYEDLSELYSYSLSHRGPPLIS